MSSSPPSPPPRRPSSSSLSPNDDDDDDGGGGRGWNLVRDCCVDQYVAEDHGDDAVTVLAPPANDVGGRDLILEEEEEGPYDEDGGAGGSDVLVPRSRPDVDDGGSDESSEDEDTIDFSAEFRETEEEEEEEEDAEGGGRADDAGPGPPSPCARKKEKNDVRTNDSPSSSTLRKLREMVGKNDARRFRHQRNEPKTMAEGGPADDDGGAAGSTTIPPKKKMTELELLRQEQRMTSLRKRRERKNTKKTVVERTNEYLYSNVEDSYDDDDDPKIEAYESSGSDSDDAGIKEDDAFSHPTAMWSELSPIPIASSRETVAAVFCGKSVAADYAASSNNIHSSDGEEESATASTTPLFSTPTASDDDPGGYDRRRKRWQRVQRAIASKREKEIVVEESGGIDDVASSAKPFISSQEIITDLDLLEVNCDKVDRIDVASPNDGSDGVPACTPDDRRPDLPSLLDLDMPHEGEAGEEGIFPTDGIEGTSPVVVQSIIESFSYGCDTVAIGYDTVVTNIVDVEYCPSWIDDKEDGDAAERGATAASAARMDSTRKSRDDVAAGGEDRPGQTAGGCAEVEEDVTGKEEIPPKSGFLKRALQKSKRSSKKKEIAEMERIVKEEAVGQESSGTDLIAHPADEARLPERAIAVEGGTSFKTPTKKKHSFLPRAFSRSKTPITAKIVTRDDFHDDDCIIAKDEDDAACGVDLSVTPNGVEMTQTPSKRGPFFDCNLSPITIYSSPGTFTSTPGKVGSGGVAVEKNGRFSNDVTASCSLTDDSSCTVDATPPPSSTHSFAKQLNSPPTPTKNGESWNVGSFLFGTASPPSPSNSILFSSPGLLADVRSPTPVSDIGGEDVQYFECTLQKTSAGKGSVNISVERGETTGKECINQQPSQPQVYNPPTVNRKLRFDADFNPCFSKASYQSRSIKDSLVYINDSAGVIARKGAKNELALAKQHALEIVKQARSRGKMKHKSRTTHQTREARTVDGMQQSMDEVSVVPICRTNSFLSHD